MLVSENLIQIGRITARSDFSLLFDLRESEVRALALSTHRYRQSGRWCLHHTGKLVLFTDWLD
jgi:hypothetical protein